MKAGTHDALLAEQMGVCVYCGRALSPDRHDSHIDHFRPQAKFNQESLPDLTLSYQNLVVSCGPNRCPIGSAKRRASTCGEAKGDWFDDALHVDPTDENCGSRFAYGTSGMVLPKANQDRAAEKMVSVLNLNENSLSYERSIIISAIEKDIIDGIITSSNKEAEISYFLNPTQNSVISTFAHVAARYIEDEIM